ncbi:MAG: transporter associated domain-containing protein, partial [Halanaerobiales bacterium]
IISGVTSLDRVTEVLDVDLPVDDYDTLSGFIIGQLGRIPEEGETPVVEYDEIIFKVEEIEEKRIAKVKACRT